MVLILLALACAPPPAADSGDPADAGTQAGPARVELGPDVLDFGLVIAGSSEERIVSVRNVGDRPVALDVRMEVDLPQAFTVRPDRVSVAPDDYENVTFTFEPEAWAVFNGAAVFSEADVDLARAELSTEVMADRDADGWGAERHGGGDCDDDDPAVNPGTPETWYDGVDSDCDGGSDFDADGDGFDATGGDGAADCDDEDPARNPGMDETWYDGVDANCDGANDFDADGDGDPSLDHGGTDCVDEDPRLSGLDGGPGCLHGTLDAMAADHVLAGAGDDAAVLDVDGDGLADLLLTDSDSGLSILLGPVSGTSRLLDATAWSGRSAERLVLGDLDGDPSPDALIFDELSGAVQRLHGPLARGGELRQDATKLRTPGPADRPVVAAVADDIDGDGIGDAAIGWPGRDSLPGSRPVTLVFTDEDGLPDIRLRGAAGTAAGASLLGPGDLDGDGYADLLIGGPGDAGAVWLVQGPIESDLELADEPVRLEGGDGDGLGAAMAWRDGFAWIRSDAGWSRVDGTWDGVVSVGPAVRAPGAGAFAAADADGDGTTDALVGLPGEDAVAWLPAAEGDAATAPLRIEGSGATGLGHRATLGDLDLDGHTDLILPAAGPESTLLFWGPVRRP